MSLALTVDRVVLWCSLNRDGLRRVGLIAALALFAGGLFLSIRANPDVLGQLSVAPLLVLLCVALPIGLALSAADFQVMGAMSSCRVGFWPAVRICLYSRAANMLPIPGSLAVRMGALKVHGVTFRRSGGLIILFTLIWGGIGFCFSALWLALQAPWELSAIFGLIGLAILAGCTYFAHRTGLSLPLFLAAAVYRFGLVVVEAYALMMGIHAIGAAAEYQQAAILVVASFLSSVVPAGIGVRETLIAILSPMAGIDPATGFLAATTTRIVGMAFLALLTAISYAASRR
ncbi:MAG: hypothetical protein R3322_04310 [Kiloniellales bacterium]|nr:hypothetical protein [Kiloniellales bacterium]